jgi:hypothetical protein
MVTTEQTSARDDVNPEEAQVMLAVVGRLLAALSAPAGSAEGAPPPPPPESRLPARYRPGSPLHWDYRGDEGIDEGITVASGPR